MREEAARLRALRHRRELARTTFEARLESVKANLAPASLRSRAVDRAKETALDMFDTSLDVARESKGVIAGVIAALTLWFLRQPIIGWIDEQVSAWTEDGDEDDG